MADHTSRHKNQRPVRPGVLSMGAIGGPSQDKETLQQDLAKALARVDVLTAGKVPGSAWLT